MNTRKTWLSLLLLAGASGAQASLIDTASLWDQDHGTFPFGRPNTASIGQTFNTGAGNFVSGLAFYVKDELVGQPVEFEVWLARWDGEKAVAAGATRLALMSSDGSGGYQRFQVGQGAYVDPFADYLFFLTTSYSHFNQPDSEAWVGSLQEDGYLGGDLVFLNNGDQFDAAFSDSWNYWYDADLAFELNVSDVPEPAGLALFGLGLFAVAARRARRR